MSEGRVDFVSLRDIARLSAQDAREEVMTSSKLRELAERVDGLRRVQTTANSVCDTVEELEAYHDRLASEVDRIAHVLAEALRALAASQENRNG